MSSPQPKYQSKLHTLIARGPNPTKRAWQDSILTYLTQNCTVSNSLLKREQKLYFPSPLPVNVVAKHSLLNELRIHEHGDTPLTLAVRCKCTADVIAALCHLFPEGSKIADKRGSLPLHIAAMRPSNESTTSKKKRLSESELSKTIGILVEANPTALVARDNNGKTPLHVLLENHAATRNLATVELLGRIVEEKVWKFEVEAKTHHEEEIVPMPIPSIIRKKLPKQPDSRVNLYTPASAIAIPDKVVGGIPLHYAAKNGVSKDIVAYLIKAYPASVCQIDCNHQTALHWMFGVKERNIDNSNASQVPAHHVYRSSSVISILLHRDASQTYNVAAMKDRNENGDPHRTPLHYAVELLAKNIVDPIPTSGNSEGASSSCITLNSLKALVEADSKALITKDSLGQTPLHVLFRTIFERNDWEYKKALNIIRTGAQVGDLPQRPKVFNPPKVLVDLLTLGTPQESVNPATIADIKGLLPLHCAVLAVTSPLILGCMIHHNPKALTQLTGSSENEYISTYYELVPQHEPLYVSSFGGQRTPLHMVYASPFFINSYTEVMVDTLLYYDSASYNGIDSQPIKIDASIALKTQDEDGNTPLHLAAKNFANIEMLHKLLKRDVLSCLIRNKYGDLPLHLLMDRHFLFVNAELASAHSGSRDANNPFNTQHTPEFRDKVRELAKKQTIATRMAKFKLCGAIFAPTSGWTNDNEESDQKDQLEMMQKINLLGMTLINDVSSLNAASSQHGLLPLHILVAFHAAPYRVISYMMYMSPETAVYESNLDGYTALDLHLFRKKIPGEIRKHELEAWRAIRQLLFVHMLYPLDGASFESGAVFQCRNDTETIHDCEQQILAEMTGQGNYSYHMKGNHPVEANHLLLGFLDGFQHDERLIDESDAVLSATCMKIWVMMTCYCNFSDPGDNYADSVARILGQLNCEQIDTLTEMKIPSYAFSNAYIPSRHEKYPDVSIYNYCNVYCKEKMYSYKNFAGMYLFNPPSYGSSILIHRERCSQSILIRASEEKFVVNSPGDEHRDPDGEHRPQSSSWMFHPTSDVRFRSDFSLQETPVCMKLMKNKVDFEREVNWRNELSSIKTSNLVIPILNAFGDSDEEKNLRYLKDRQDERFSKMPLRSNSTKSDAKEWVNLSHYPYAIVFPFSSDGNLFEVLNHGLVDPRSIKYIATDMGHVMKDLHEKGLIHSTFSARNILSFPLQKEGIWTREWKLSGLNSILPVRQTSVYLGAINPSGRCSFDSEVLPPEMFKKLDSLELAFYNNYWQAVCALPHVNISKEFYNPRIDPETGDVYVVKCYCNIDEESKRSLPPLPYDLVAPSPAADIWSFGVFLFTLVTGGEKLFHSNGRTCNISATEAAANWTDNKATDVIQQFVEDPVAQDLLLYLMSSYEERSQIDMNTILCHPYFVDDEVMLPKEVKQALVDARDEREEGYKIRIKSKESKTKANDLKNQTQLLSRMKLRNHLLLVNSATEVIKQAFGANETDEEVPYSFILLPYKLARNKAGKLTPTSMTDVGLAERLGKQLLELSKAICFATCLKEFYSTADKESLELIHVWSGILDKYPIQTAEEMLKTFHLDTDNFLDLGSKFVALVRADKKTFVTNPITSAMKLVKKFATPVPQIFAVTGKAYLYLVDEYTGIPIVESSKGRTYPHTFRDHVSDIVYKFLPYMQTCITRMMSESGSVESLVKLIFEGASPNTPNSWVQTSKGLPKVFLKRRLVSEAHILRDSVREYIPENSPVALNGKKQELDFIHSLYTHIDSSRTFGGLKPVSDGTATMWTSQEGINELLEDSKKESDPDHLYNMYKKESANNDIIFEKDAQIAKLEKAVDSLSKTLASMEDRQGMIEV